MRRANRTKKPRRRRGRKTAAKIASPPLFPSIALPPRPLPPLVLKATRIARNRKLDPRRAISNNAQLVTLPTIFSRPRIIPDGTYLDQPLVHNILNGFTLNPAAFTQAYGDISENDRAAFRTALRAIHNQLARIEDPLIGPTDLPRIDHIYDHNICKGGIDYKVGIGREDWVRDLNIGAYPNARFALSRYWSGMTRASPPFITSYKARRLRNQASQYRGTHGIWLERFYDRSRPY